MKGLKYYIYCLMFVMLSCISCTSDITVEGELNQESPIYPDYSGVTVPFNIAPLNFHIEGDGKYCAIFDYQGKRLTLQAKSGDIVIPKNKWSEMTCEKSDSVTVTVCEKSERGWMAYKPFTIYVSLDKIDKMLAYRLLPPLYGTWREIGIYQRDLESYDETPIYQNTSYHGNCVNCHSFCNRDAEVMMFHLRGPGGATYMMKGDEKLRLDTKTPETISNFTYPYWHPSGRFVAFSVNDIFQIFHTTDPNRTEVIDDDSDVVVYDIESNEIISTPLIKSEDRLETFPSFSPDGKTLYFCSALKPDTLPEQYKEVKYSLCSISFDAESREFGNRVDTLFNAQSTDSIYPFGSMSVPRPSPDGLRLVATASEYGQFMIWHKDADLWMYDLESGKWTPMTAANSDDVESYHSWSDNSRWMVFSSRRDDGLYTRPYIVHISEDGSVAKPFMLPQKYPKKYYRDQENSYNIPEFVKDKVNLTSEDVVKWIECPAKQVR